MLLKINHILTIYIYENINFKFKKNVGPHITIYYDKLY